MNKTILIPVLAIVALGAIGFIYSTTIQSEKAAMKQTETKMEEKMEAKNADSMEEKMAKQASDVMSTSSDSMIAKAESQMKQPETEAMADKKSDAMATVETAAIAQAGTYTTYSASTLAAAKTNKVVLFFHAAWCPSCRALDAEITTMGVKSGVTVLKVDYDSANVLKAKYGVTTQHTLVQVTKDGELITKWSGGDLASIYSRIK
jgi:thioredoxin 1